MILSRARSVMVLAAMLSIVPLLPAQAASLIRDGGFDAGDDAFWGSGGVKLSREGGVLCAAVPPRGNPWDRMIGVNDLPLEAGRFYSLSLSVQGSGDGAVPILVQSGNEPWTPYATIDADKAQPAGAVTARFRMPQSDAAQLLFHLGGAANDFRFCIDNVVLEAEQAADVAPYTARAIGPAIRINQAGYLTDGPKRATIPSDSEMPLRFELVDGSGRAIGTGMTAPMGFDASAGMAVHVADFSSVRRAGDGYRILAEGQESYPFSIGTGIYGRLRVDALSWFYPQRSGIEIRGDVAGAAYARPAGHVGIAPNRGDTAVGCLKGEIATALYGAGFGCDYSLDVSGGWYDAGDHGKYVVNGGIAVAQLMAAFERGSVFGGGGSAVLSDSLSRSPDNGNGVPDILDEARWELEFLLKMTVPDGQPLAGMAHHKVHDTRWTAIPMLPHLDPQERALHRPSTTATLNVAAAAAQGARLFRVYDPGFADRLLDAARKSWLAAAANPVMLAPLSDGQQGGGDYQDDTITDETYWAAAELFMTTGEEQYLSALKASPHWAGPVFSPAGSFDWRGVAGLARVQLALFGNGLGADDRQMVRDSVVSAAREFLSLQALEPFGQIYRPEEGAYAWGSNQLILQNMVVVAAAFDLTGETPFLNGVRESMDYLLGRNAMNMSYITGYGAVSSQNQHSRWYAHQADPNLPNPPPGSLAGGPNSTLVDEVAKSRLEGCPPQQCYIDDIMSWGTNEITINWNAPLLYVASFLADASPRGQ